MNALQKLSEFVDLQQLQVTLLLVGLAVFVLMLVCMLLGAPPPGAEIAGRVTMSGQARHA